MKYIFLSFFLYLYSNCFAQELVNLASAKTAIEKYYSSGQYETELNAIVHNALTKAADLPNGNNDAAIFDIDETSLSNYPIMLKYDFGYEAKAWDDWVRGKFAKAIPQVKMLYDSLIARKIKIIFLTGRAADILPASKQNLIEAGYITFDTLVGKSVGDMKTTAAVFKENKRKEFTAKGYNIILCVGDQWSDLFGECTGIKVKVPNYLYIIE